MTRSPVAYRAEILIYVRNNSVVVLEHYGILLKYPIVIFCWKKPPMEYYKLNSDGPFCRGGDVIVKNTNGLIEFSACYTIPFVTFGYEVEVKENKTRKVL